MAASSTRAGRTIAAAALGVLLGATSARAYTAEELMKSRLDPRIRFQTIETAHFRIHYDPRLTESAHTLARLAEPVQAAVSKRLEWEVRRKTDLVLAPSNDRTEAFTISFPTTQIFMSDAPPHLSQGIFHYGDWLRWLLVHEYAHVVHLDRVSGLSRALRPALGIFARPNMLQPTWFREGLATVVETELDSAGRADSTTYRMMLRAAEREGELGTAGFGSPSTAASPMGERWPWVLRSYLWGSVLVQTMEDASPGASTRLTETGASGLPGLFADDLSRAGLPGSAALQRRAAEWTRARAQEELAVLGRRPETAATRLTDDGYGKFGPIVAPDGGEIVYTRERPQDDNAVILIPLDADGAPGKPRELTPRGSGYQLSYSRSSRFLAFDTLTYHDNYYTWSDLFLFDRVGDAAVLRSRGLRGRDPDIHPDGVHLAFVQQIDGRQAIVRSDSGFGEVEVLYRAEPAVRLAQPRWHPDGERLAFIEHDNRGGEKLVLLSAEGMRDLTDGTSQDRDPAWSPDGRRLLFSSDRGGTFQIFALDIASGDLRQVTHRYGGASSPAPDPQGRFLAFLDYTARGFDLARMEWNPETWWTPDPTIWIPGREETSSGGTGRRASEPVVADETASTASRPYSGLRYLAPQYLQPSLALREAGPQVGFALGGVDPAFHQFYEMGARWDTAHDTVVGRGFYYDARRRLPFTLEATRDVSDLGNSQEALDVTTAQAHVYVPLGTHRDRHLAFGLTGQRYSTGADAQKLAGLSAVLQHDSLVKQPNDFVPETGEMFRLELRELARHRDSPVFLTEARYERPFRLKPFGAHTVLRTTLEGAFVDRGKGAEYLLFAGGRESLPFSLSSAFELAGYAPNQLPADRLVIARAHLSRPVWTVERSFVSLPVYLDRVGVGLRAEAGRLERDGAGTTAWTLGGELLADLELAHIWPMRFTAGLYRGREENGGSTRFVIALGSR